MPEPVSYWNKFNFVVESDALGGRMGFMTCSEIAAEAETIMHYQGGDAIANKSPGLVTFPDVTLTQGAARDRDRVMLDWFLRTYNAASGEGTVPPDLYTTVDIIQLNYTHQIVQRWTLYDAYCSRFSSGDWDNATSEKRVVEVTLAYRRFVLAEQ